MQSKLFQKFKNFLSVEQTPLSGLPAFGRMDDNFRPLLKPALYSFFMYIVAISAILRANFNYVDDMGRSLSGYRIWDTSSRYVNQWLSVLLHTDNHLTDISPLTQVLAAGVIAAGSVALVYILSDGRVTVPKLIAALPLGLSPYFLCCISYKFDAPYMAMSVTASIVPFVFANSRRWLFGAVSVGCLLVMCMSYQASSGIYIMLLIVLCFREWNEKGQRSRDGVKFLLYGGALYVLSLLIYKLFFMHPVNSYYSTDLFPPAAFLPGVAANLGKYISSIEAASNPLWTALTIAVAVLFVVVLVANSKRRRAAALFSSLGILALMFFVSYGIYLAMQGPQFATRALLGAGALLAVLCVTAVRVRPRPLALPVFALCWCFFVFSFTYGNALAEQKDYVDFRTDILAADLGRAFPTEDLTKMTMRIEGTAGYAAPIEKNIALRYPVIKTMVPVQLCST
ncbi:MAG: glucosyltransferase domain-containing protein, partial [Clostridiales Family XIII bacterium]|nr:glucosyltransferase domain-containing protein [Clostridiales Family XIII bacterium]